MSKAVTTAEFTSDLPASLGSAGKVLTVNSGATAFGWGDAFAYPTGAAAGQVLQRNAGNSAYEWGDGLPTGASAGQVLQRNAGDSAYEWGTIASGTPAVVFPNLASPTNTYTSSGTWSKGSLADTDFVWMYLCGGGYGGNSASYPSTSSGGKGGGAVLVYGTAGHFNGAAYVIGAGGAGGSGGNGTAGSLSSITTSSANGSFAYNTLVGGWADTHATDLPNKIMVSAPDGIVTQSTTLASGRTKTPYDFIFAANSEPTGWSGAVTGQWGQYQWTNAGVTTGAGINGIFGGGGGGGKIQYGGNPLVSVPGGSLYAGVGGAHPNGTGSVPGGGGGGHSSNGQAGAGGAGNLRVYHV